MIGGLLTRTGFALRGVASLGFYAATGQWDGWSQSRVRNRPATRNVAQDTDLDFGVREGLVGEARSLCQTVGICNAITNKFADYVVGSCRVKWSTEDDDVNESYENGWKSWMQIADYRGMHSLPMIARLAVKSQIRDGDVFFNETFDGGFYQLQPIEADRVRNGLSRTMDNNGSIGGVRVDKSERPTFYRVWDRGGHGIFKNEQQVPANQIMHLFDTDRIDAHRGVTAFKCALDHLRDWKETIQAEKTAQKAASKIAMLAKNNIAGAIAGSKNIFGTDDTTAAGNAVAVEEISDGVIKYMFPNESLEAFAHQRPGDGFFKLGLMLLRDISVGMNLPFEFVWDMAGLAGPGVRLMSKQAERVFARKQDLLEWQFLNRCAVKWLAYEIQVGRQPFHEQWTRFKVQRPAHISIDAGRESAADISEADEAIGNIEEMAEERGGDLYENLVSKARRAKWAQEIADEMGVSVTEILPRNATSTAGPPDQAPQDPQRNRQNQPANTPAT